MPAVQTVTIASHHALSRLGGHGGRRLRTIDEGIGQLRGIRAIRGIRASTLDIEAAQIFAGRRTISARFVLTEQQSGGLRLRKLRPNRLETRDKNPDFKNPLICHNLQQSSFSGV
jgi:hypothetical protein